MMPSLTMEARHGETERLTSDDDGVFDISDDDSITGSLSDAYFLQRSENSAAKVSSHSLWYSPTSPLDKHHAKRPAAVDPAIVPTLTNHKVGKPPSIKTGDIFYQGSGKTWWHASEYDPLYDHASPASTRTTSYDAFHPIQEDELYEEEKVMMSLQIPQGSAETPQHYQTIPTQSASRREKRRVRQIRKKQMQSIEREQRVKQVRGTPQHYTGCHDFVFAVLFVMQLVLVVFCAIRFGSGTLFLDEEKGGWYPFRAVLDNSNDDTVRFLSHTSITASDDDAALTQFVSNTVAANSTNHVAHVATSFVLNYKTVMSIVGITGFYACILSVVTVGFMLIIAKSLIETALIFCIILSLAWGVIGYVVEPQHFMVPTFGFVALFLFVGYTIYVWDRIPFSATNLNTALHAMKSTADILLLGMLMLAVAFAWCLVWSMAFIGLVDTLDECEPGEMACRHVQEHHGWHMLLFSLFFFSFYWTNVVINNITRVTVANAVGTWWFHPEEVSPCCSRSITRAFLRAISTSLGSICLGSLVIIPAQLLRSCCCCLFRNPYRPMAPQRRWCGCVWLQDFKLWLRRCNRWSFSYIGMYGYTFSDGGEKALALFETREWMDVVSDNLIHNVLLMASVVIGGSAGVFGILVEEVDGYTFTSFHKPIITAFLIGSVLGFVLSNVLLLGVVGSAVNTILVCFAAGPFEFHKNHAILSQEMRDVWSQQVWEPSV